MVKKAKTKNWKLCLDRLEGLNEATLSMCGLLGLKQDLVTYQEIKDSGGKHETTETKQQHKIMAAWYLARENEEAQKILLGGFQPFQLSE